MSHQEHVSELRRLAPIFDNHGLDWCLIKWPPDGREHDDIDVLAGDPEKMVCVAEENGYRYEHDADQYRRKMVRGDVELDIHTEPAWVGIKYMDADRVLESRRSGERSGVDVPVPSPEIDLLIWAAHDLRSNDVPKHDVDYCRGLIPQVNMESCRGIASEYGWLVQFDEFIHIVRTHRNAPEEAFPVRLPLTDSLFLKVWLVLTIRRRRGWRAGASSAWAIARFDVPHVARRMLP